MGSTAECAWAPWHNFLGLGRAILRDEFPDIYATLLTQGAGEIRQDSFLGDAERAPGDLAANRRRMRGRPDQSQVRRHGVHFSVTARKDKAVQAAIASIPDE